MNRKARAALTMPLIVLVAGGLLEIACRGGGPLDQLDGGFDGEATRQASGRAPANGDACAVETVTIEDNAATENASSGGPGCTSDDECTVRFAGDYCACPSTPRPMLTSGSDARVRSRHAWRRLRQRRAAAKAAASSSTPASER